MRPNRSSLLSATRAILCASRVLDQKLSKGFFWLALQTRCFGTRDWRCCQSRYLRRSGRENIGGPKVAGQIAATKAKIAACSRARKVLVSSYEKDSVDCLPCPCCKTCPSKNNCGCAYQMTTRRPTHVCCGFFLGPSGIHSPTTIVIVMSMLRIVYKRAINRIAPNPYKGIITLYILYSKISPSLSI